MTYILGHDRSQILLLPEAVDDYVDPDNPVRFIDAFVDGLKLKLKLTRFRGARQAFNGGFSDAQVASALFT